MATKQKHDGQDKAFELIYLSAFYDSRLTQTLIAILININCETKPLASIGWVARLSSLVRPSVPPGNMVSYIHYMMF